MAEEHQNTGGTYPGHTQEMSPCPVQADSQLEVGSEADLLQGAVQDPLRSGTTAEAVVTDWGETAEAELLEAMALTLSDLPDLHCRTASQNIFVVLVFSALAEVLAVLCVPQTSLLCALLIKRLANICYFTLLRVKHSILTSFWLADYQKVPAHNHVSL